MDKVIQVEKADIFQEDKCVLKDVTFDLDKGEFAYLIGRTGSGKSSLLKTLYADLRPETGNITVAGYSLNHIKKKEVPYLRRKLGIVFQDFELFMDRSVYDNLLFVLKATGWTSKSKIKKRISEVLMRVGLESSHAKMPHQLSGGEQQRIVIARALLNEPLLLITDEPTGNLDPEVGEEIMKLFYEINNAGTAVLMATHNLQFIEKFPAKTFQCKDGKISVI